MEAVECGAAALGIVLAYYGRIVPLEELRIACGVSRDGSKANNIVKVARSYGLVAGGRRAEPEDLWPLRLPLIVYWSFNHFVVVEGFDRRRFYLNDPAVGPRTVSHEEFDRSFTGVVLVFEPGASFEKGGASPSLVRGLAARLSGSWAGLIYCVLVGLVLVVPGLAIPIFAKVFVDDYLVRGMSGWVGPLLVGMGLTATLQAALTWLRQRYLLRLNTRLAVSMSSEFFWHVLRLPLQFFTQRYAGEIGWRVRLNDTVARLLSGQLATTMLSIVTVVFYTALLLYYDVRLTFVGIGFALINLAALSYVSRMRIDLNRRLAQEQGKLMGLSMAGLQMIENLKATGGESDFFARWAGSQAKVINARQELGVPSEFLTAVPPLLALLNTSAILTVGGLRVMHGDLTVGTLVAFQALMASFTQPFSDFVGLGAGLHEVQEGINRLDDVLRHPVDTGLRGHAPAGGPMADHGCFGEVVKLGGRLELRNVSFGYSPLEPPLIERFNLVVEPGQRVALVGTSGSGKSTVSRLVCGLFEPWEGEILLDGAPRQAIPRHVVNNSLALVDQEIFLFEGTVAENLTLWDPTIPEAQVVRAAKDACIHDDVAARPAGYASRVHESGRNFSGGQAQRLEIARALAGNPSILVLDEATASLDAITEQQVVENLRRRGCTCLIVAHRLSTIRDCDEIVVLEDGNAVQRGSHEALKDVDGPYARLIAS
jgi:NHLM bacteriocin system ABC transporter peptidase/ATP-binding protein